MKATTDVVLVYRNTDFIIIATLTNYDSNRNFLDTSAVESTVRLVSSESSNAAIGIKNTVPVGYTVSLREKYKGNHILFSPEFFRES